MVISLGSRELLLTWKPQVSGALHHCHLTGMISKTIYEIPDDREFSRNPTHTPISGMGKLKTKATVAHRCPFPSVRCQPHCRTADRIMNLLGREEHSKQLKWPDGSHNSFTCYSGTNSWVSISSGFWFVFFNMWSYLAASSQELLPLPQVWEWFRKNVGKPTRI